MLHGPTRCFSLSKSARSVPVTPRVVAANPKPSLRLVTPHAQPRVRCSAVYNRSGSFGPDDGIKWPPESDEVTALRKSLFALENERDDVVRIGEAAARSSVQLSEDVSKWNDVAVQRLQRNDDQGARNALREKATCSESMEKSTAKAQAHFALAAKIAEKIGMVQSKLVNLGALSPSQAPPPASPQYSPPQAPPPQQWPPQPQQMAQGSLSYPEVPKYQPIAPSGGYASTGPQKGYQQPSAPPSAQGGGYQASRGAPSSQGGYQPSAAPAQGGGYQPSGGAPSSSSSEGYQPLQPNQGVGSSAPSWGGSSQQQPPIPSSYITPGSPLSAGYAPAPANWQVSLEAAQKRVREAEALGQGARSSAEDKIYEAQERLRGKIPDAGVGRETLWAQRHRMRVTSEEAIAEAQQRLRGQDAEILGYARRVVDRYKRGEYVSDEQLEFAFRQLERLTY